MIENYPTFFPQGYLQNIQKLISEPSYFEKIKQIKELGVFIKRLKSFKTRQEAHDYLLRRPDKISGFLAFFPKTEYVLGDGNNNEVVVYAFSTEIEGIRLDEISLSDQSSDLYRQLDDFMIASFTHFTETKELAGINWKNFILSDNKIYFVDSEPFPTVNRELFEIAEARHRRLKKDFGDKYEELLPISSEWIKKHRVLNYKEALAQAKKVRK